tara:strand:- start:1897 stop:3696 length:1800 start_codon:yes stop_codon:yes gene_type:complete
MTNRIEITNTAIDRWGQPNKSLSSKDELRFGSHGSVSVKLATNEWYDHEISEGGKVVKKELPEVTRPRVCVAKYNYVNEQGETHLQVLRYMPKDFRQRRPDPNDPSKWIWSVKGIAQVPYRVTEILKSDYVIVCEGEKDADNLMAAGFVATCNAQGANKWADELTPYFKGKDVYIIPDNDSAGRDHAQLVTNKLFGNCNSVRVADICKDMRARSDISDWLEDNDASNLMAEILGFEAVTAVSAEPVIDVNNSDIFLTLDADEIKAVTEADDFVEGLLGAGQLSVLYGPSNCGKTFFMSDLCLHIAMGKTWRGREIDAGGVLYVAAEGAYGIRNRIAAYKQYHELESGIPLTILPSSINMLDAEQDVEKLIRTIQVKAQELGNIQMIVLDTLARVMTGNENAAEDMGMLVINCDKISQTTGAHVCLIHHSGKDESKGSRGSSSLRAACSTEIEIKKGGDVSVATVTKQREMEISGEFAFKLKVVEIGTNQRGKTITSCVVVEADKAESDRKKRKPRGANQKILLKAMINLGAGGDLQDNRLGLPITCKGLPIDKFFELSKGKISCDARHKRSRFNDAISSLVADEFMGLENEFLWLVPNG